MADAADEVTRSEAVPDAPAADEDWFNQIPFDPRRGLNSVLPLDVPQPLPARVVDPDAEVR